MVNKISKNLNNPKFIDRILPFLIIILIALMFLFTFSCVKTSQSAFRYNIKVREKANEIYQVFQLSESNIKVLSSTIEQSYDLNKINDFNYNKYYASENQKLIKAIAVEIPASQGAWYVIKNNLSDSYVYYIKKNGKLVLSNEDIFNRYNEIKKYPTTKHYYNNEKDIITISEPIYKNNILIGFVGVDISIKSLMTTLNNIQREFSGSDVFLLNEKNKPLIMCFAKSKKPGEKNIKLLKNYAQNPSLQDDIVVYQERWGSNTALILQMKNGYKMVMSCPNMVIYKGNSRLYEAIYLFLTVLFLFLIIFLYNKKKIIIINKQLEDGLSTQKIILNSSPMGIAIKNTQGLYVDCNEKYAIMMNAPYEEIIGKDDYSLFDRAVADAFIAKDNYVKFKNAALHEEDWFTNSAGQKLLLEKYRIPLFSSDNELMGILITVRDVTKRREEQESLRKAKDAAEKATEMKSSFLANMSHEIRTPLNGVLGFLQLLDSTDLSEIQKEFVNNAQKSSELLLTIINEILDISKIEAGKMSIDSTSFNIRSAVEDVTTIASSNEKAAGININSLIRSDVPQRVLGDPGRVKQILTNLMGNAVKFTQQGEVIIYVNKLAETKEDVTVCFKVKDTGIGIPKDKLDSIFGAFIQADASTTRNFGGTGLGLAISKKLAMLMNGDIDVLSEVGEGSTFTLTLKFKKDLSSSLTTNNLSKNLNGISILVIDDKPTDLKIISHYINDANGIVVEADTIESAINVIKQKDENISVILIDSKIHVGLNFDLNEVIKKEYKKEIPMILYTSLTKRGDAILSKQKGFAGYLTKPIKKHELLEGIAIAVNGVKNNLENKFISKHLIKETKFDSKAKILVVEDSELNIKLILNIFKNANLNCDIAVNGKDAIEAFKSNRYDIILMDCELPEMDGYQATQNIRMIEGNLKHVPIIAMTANVLNEDKEKCYQAGMDDYLSKPINIKDFYDKLSKYIKLETEADKDSEFKEETSEEIIKKIMLDLDFSREEAYEIFSKYLEVMPQNISELQNGLNNENFDIIFQVVHKVKGSSANLRVDGMVYICDGMNFAIEKADLDMFQNKLDEMKNYYGVLMSSTSPEIYY